MAKPRVFISSTYYDLKHIRSSLDIFIESLGFESVLSEKGDIAFAPDLALDESCYREVGSCDIFVLIVGGRFGSAASDQQKKPARDFFENYDSITKKEYDHAVQRNIPTYILVEDSVYSEYQTYLRNKDNISIDYAHVDSINIFRLIEGILAKPKNNPIHTFERASEIEAWLREQWSGLFRELLQRMTSQQQLATLSAQVEELKETNNTLRRYLEAVMTDTSRDDRVRLIESEEERLSRLQQRDTLKKSEWYDYVNGRIEEHLSLDDFIMAVTTAKSFADFANNIGALAHDPQLRECILRDLKEYREARKEFNEARKTLGLSPFRSTERALAELGPSEEEE